MIVVVVFTPNNARILHNPPDIDVFAIRDDVLINPEIPQGVPPQFWKKVGNKIEVMTISEMQERQSHIDEHGAINSVHPTYIEPLGTIKEYQAALEVLSYGKVLIVILIIITLFIGYYKFHK